MRTDLRKRKPSPIRKRRIIRNSDSPDEDEEEAMIGTVDRPTKTPATVQGKSKDQ